MINQKIMSIFVIFNIIATPHLIAKDDLAIEEASRASNLKAAVDYYKFLSENLNELESGDPEKNSQLSALRSELKKERIHRLNHCYEQIENGLLKVGTPLKDVEKNFRSLIKTRSENKIVLWMFLDSKAASKFENIYRRLGTFADGRWALSVEFKNGKVVQCGMFKGRLKEHMKTFKETKKEYEEFMKRYPK